jgi:hypothetical protein
MLRRVGFSRGMPAPWRSSLSAVESRSDSNLRISHNRGDAVSRVSVAHVGALRQHSRLLGLRLPQWIFFRLAILRRSELHEVRKGSETSFF